MYIYTHIYIHTHAQRYLNNLPQIGKEILQIKKKNVKLPIEKWAKSMNRKLIEEN